MAQGIDGRIGKKYFICNSLIMVKLTTITDRGTGETRYPITSTKAVFDERGVDLDTLMDEQKRETANTLKNYATATALTEGLAGKQDALSTTMDLRLTNDNILGLTDMAKKRLFIDLWNEACGAWGQYNAETGFFELNGLTDIGYEEAVRIYSLCVGWHGNVGSGSASAALSRSLGIRTALPIYYGAGDVGLDLAGFAHSNGSIEVINFVTNASNNLTSALNYAFYGCSKLVRIEGVIYIRNSANVSWAFHSCVKLESVKLHSLAKDLDLSSCRVISLESLRYMVDYSRVTNAITITVYKDIYAKLTDEGNEEWHAVLEAAAEKNITFATV